MANPFIKTVRSENIIDSIANKYALAQVVSEIAIVVSGYEKEIEPDRQYPGSDNDTNYRKLITLLINAGHKDPNILNHPYIAITKRIIHIGDIDQKIINYAETQSIPEYFNIDEYLNLICKRDANNGNIIGLKDYLFQKDVYGNFIYDKTTKDNLSEAFGNFFDNLNSLDNQKKTPMNDNTNNKK